MVNKKKKQKNNNIWHSLIILGTISLGVIIWYSWPRPTPVAINQVGSETGTVTLSFSPATLNLEPNAEATLTLSINADISPVTVAQVELTYDTTKIDPPTLTPGDFLSSSLGTSTVADGKINFTYVAPATSGGITGSGILATIKVKPTVIGSSSLAVTENTIILAGTETNALKSVNDATIIADSSVSPTPNPTPTPTPTPKPTARPTVKPTLRPTSTPITRTPTPRPSSPPSPNPYTCPELCGDGVCNIACGESSQNCQADCTLNNYSTGFNVSEVTVTPPSFWQKILNWISSLFVPTQN